MSSTTEDGRPRVRNESLSNWVTWNPSYVLYEWQGRIKVAEIICSFLTGIILPYYPYNYPGHYDFLGFVAWTTLLNAVIDLILHLLSLWERLIFICRAPEVYMVLDAVATVAFFLGSCLIASVARGSGYPGSTGASAFFGFMCMILFAIETFIHYQRWRQGTNDRSSQVNREDNMEGDNKIADVI